MDNREAWTRAAGSNGRVLGRHDHRDDHRGSPSLDRSLPAADSDLSCPLAGFLVLYLLTGREITKPQLAKVAWLAGAVAIALFLVALISNVASEEFKSWFEAFEAAGSMAMLVSIMTAIWSVGGWASTS